MQWTGFRLHPPEGRADRSAGFPGPRLWPGFPDEKQRPGSSPRSVPWSLVYAVRVFCSPLWARPGRRSVSSRLLAAAHPRAARIPRECRHQDDDTHRRVRHAQLGGFALAGASNHHSAGIHCGEEVVLITKLRIAHVPLWPAQRNSSLGQSLPSGCTTSDELHWRLRSLWPANDSPLR